MSDVDPGGLMRVREAAAFLGLSRSKLYALMEAGELRFAKIGKSRRIPRTELEKLVERHIVPEARPESGKPMP
jgi:excisionase family DNA binding protein